MSELPAPPYPADTKAKGWRFELDYEQIEQSDTWDLAGAEVRPWLLMMWLTAWRQVPAGSMPVDEGVIAAKLGMPAKAWAKHRAVLLRGWWKASDGRLYHPTLAKRVYEMMGRRRSDSDRKARERARKLSESAGNDTGITPESRVTPPGLPPESSTDNRLPNTSTEEGKVSGVHTEKARARRRKAPAPVSGAAAPLVSLESLVADGVVEQHAREWLAIRAKKALPLTGTAWDDTKAEAGKANLTAADAVRHCVLRGWAGFRATWLQEGDESSGQAGTRKASRTPPTEAEIRELNAATNAEALRILQGGKSATPSLELIHANG